jgi:hypothetical protein
VVDVAFQVLVWHRAALDRYWIIGNERVGFIDPVRAISALPASGARLPFGGAASKWQKYRSAWHLLPSATLSGQPSAQGLRTLDLHLY